MKAMILAAGVGSRLSPITGDTPKPMLPVANKPVMEHTIEMLVRAGITEIKANLHHLPHLVEQHFGNGRRWGANLSYSLESTLLGTAGAVKRVQRFFDDTFVVLVGDSLWDIDVAAVVAYHKACGAAVTVVVKPMPQEMVGRFGVARVDDDGRILQFQEKPRPEEACGNLVSTGFYVLEPAVLDLIPQAEFFDFARDLFPKLLERGLPFYAYCYEGPWSDIGAFREYYQVHQEILTGSYSRLHLPAREVAPGIRQGHHVRIHPGAKIQPPVMIGDYCRIARGAVVGPNTVLGPHSVVDEEARVAYSVVGAHTYIGRLLELERSLAYGRWVVRFDCGTSAYIEDDVLLSHIRGRPAGQIWSRAADLGISSLALIGGLPIFFGLGVIARLTRQPTIERTWRLAPVPGRRLPSGAPRMRPVQLLRFSPHGAVGKLAERMGVSRLPALYNVMRGDISLVGIKPMTEEEAASVSEDWLRHVGQAPAGFTGLWQIQGGDDLPLEETLAVDAYYAASKSLWNDLRILLWTATRRTR